MKKMETIWYLMIFFFLSASNKNLWSTIRKRFGREKQQKNGLKGSLSHKNPKIPFLPIIR